MTTRSEVRVLITILCYEILICVYIQFCPFLCICICKTMLCYISLNFYSTFCLLHDTFLLGLVFNLEDESVFLRNVG
jgi:hypothetical protein